MRVPCGAEMRIIACWCRMRPIHGRQVGNVGLKTLINLDSERPNSFGCSEGPTSSPKIRVVWTCYKADCKAVTYDSCWAKRKMSDSNSRIKIERGEIQSSAKTVGPEFSVRSIGGDILSDEVGKRADQDSHAEGRAEQRGGGEQASARCATRWRRTSGCGRQTSG